VARAIPWIARAQSARKPASHRSPLYLPANCNGPTTPTDHGTRYARLDISPSITARGVGGSVSLTPLTGNIPNRFRRRIRLPPHKPVAQVGYLRNPAARSVGDAGVTAPVPGAAREMPEGESIQDENSKGKSQSDISFPAHGQITQPQTALEPSIDALARPAASLHFSYRFPGGAPVCRQVGRSDDAGLR